MQREKFFLRFIKRDGMLYAVVSQHLILAERRVTRQEFTLVRNDLIKRVPARVWGDGKWASEFHHAAVKKRHEDKNADKI